MQIERLVPPDVYVKDTGTPKGRGVYASRCFQSGETVEICPAVVISVDLAAIPPAVRDRLFAWEYLLSGTRGLEALALGYGSLYNHENPANMRYIADADNETLNFVAVRDIGADEELTVNYNALGGGPEWSDDNWFARHGVTRV